MSQDMGTGVQESETQKQGSAVTKGRPSGSNQ